MLHPAGGPVGWNPRLQDQPGHGGKGPLGWSRVQEEPPPGHPSSPPEGWVFWILPQPRPVRRKEERM